MVSNPTKTSPEIKNTNNLHNSTAITPLVKHGAENVWSRHDIAIWNLINFRHRDHESRQMVFSTILFQQGPVAASCSQLQPVAAS
jgi:hypothetical protein